MFILMITYTFDPLHLLKFKTNEAQYLITDC